LKGRGWFANLFNAIASQQALEIKYQPFGQDENNFLFHPYLLKQYNNRWFLLGCVDGFNTITIFALDRINDVASANIPYKPNTDIDFQGFFEERVGVSSGKGEAEIIQIKVSNDLYNYIETKPIHGTQKKVRAAEDGVVIQIEVVINRELIQLLQFYGSGVIVLRPKELQEVIISGAKKTLQNYQSVQIN
jgi:predicted DNA-binding transcriptional regulator YafY